MDSRKAFALLIFAMLCVSCISQHKSPPMDREEAFQNWQFVEPQLQEQAELQVIVYAIKLAPGETLLICSFTADEAKKLDEAVITVQVRDEPGSASLIKKYDLGTIEQISFLALRFAPRSVGAGELYLHIDQGAQDSNLLDWLIARFSDPPEPSTLHGVRTTLMNSAQVYEQEGYRVSVAGWIDPPSAIGFSTPEPSAGERIKDKFTLEISDISSNQMTYLYIQLLSNGEVRGEMIK